MRSIKWIASIAIAIPLLSVPAVWAAGEHESHHTSAANTEKVGGDVAGMTEGEVRKVDKDARKITLKHGEIRNLEMPAMTMVFQVKDVALLEKAKAGDKVRFKAEKTAGGYAVTELEVSK